MTAPDVPNGNGKKPEAPPAVRRLLQLLVTPPQEAFRAPTGRVYVVLDGEALPVDGRAFAERLAARFLECFDEVLSEATIKNAVRVLSGRPLPRQSAPIRIGGAPGQIQIDLAVEGSRRAIEVTAGGCRVVERSETAFCRPHGTGALPEPRFPSSDAHAREVLERFFGGLGFSNRSRVAAVAFLLSAMRVEGPYTLFVVRGEQGSGKSWFVRFLRRLIDPRRPVLQRLPRNTRDLAIAAEHTHLLAFDNVSAIDGDMSDALCTIATGDGFVTRSNYTDRELAVFDAARPVLIASVTDAITRADLLDRAIVAHLEARERREDDLELEQRFKQGHPEALGALCFLAHRALQNVHAAEVPGTIRMREPARFAAAAERPAGFPPGAVAHVYLESREHAASVATLDPVVSVLLRFLRPGQEWIGTAAELLDLQRGAPGFPQTARGVRAALDRHGQALRDLGIELRLPTEGTRTGHDRTRAIVVRRRDVEPAEADGGLSRFFSQERALDRPHRPRTAEPPESEGEPRQPVPEAEPAPIRRTPPAAPIASLDRAGPPARPPAASAAANGASSHADLRPTPRAVGPREPLRNGKHPPGGKTP